MLKSFPISLFSDTEVECKGSKRQLTYRGRVTHICVNKLISISSNNSLSPGGRQATVWTNAGLLLIGPLGTNFGENSYIIVQENSFENVVCEIVAIFFLASIY